MFAIKHSAIFPQQKYRKFITFGYSIATNDVSVAFEHVHFYYMTASDLQRIIVTIIYDITLGHILLNKKSPVSIEL